MLGHGPEDPHVRNKNILFMVQGVITVSGTALLLLRVEVCVCVFLTLNGIQHIQICGRVFLDVTTFGP